MNIGEISSWIKNGYDKLILCVMLVGLLLSVVMLGVLADREKKALQDAVKERPLVQQKRPRPADLAPLMDVIEQGADPFQLELGPHRMLVAGIRVACVKCGRPIPYDAGKCPFRNCGAVQPTSPNPETKDTDLDGLPDSWEKKYGLNINADDAQKDPDKDGFSHLEEYLAGTDPLDPNSTPPPAAKLRLVKTGRIPVPFSFQGVQRLTDKDRLFVLRSRSPQRDYYAKLGDKVEGYEVLEFQEKTKAVSKPGVPQPVKVDVSVLKLRKDGKIYELTLGHDASSQGDMAASLVFLMDNSKLIVKIGDEIKLKNIKYKVVDIKKDDVILSETFSGRIMNVEKLSEADQRGRGAVKEVQSEAVPKPRNE